MNILTFDIEDWFHILDCDVTRASLDWAKFKPRIYENVDRLLGLLEEKGQKATFFCLGWIADNHPEVIRKIVAGGYEIATHSYEHQLVYEQTPEEFRVDLMRSITTLEDLSGQKIRCYRAPGFSITAGNTWAFDILGECGIEIDCSVFPASRAHGGFPEYGAAQPAVIQQNGTSLKALPLNVARVFGRDVVFSGGGYFRLFPYRFIRSLMRRAPYVMTYFHPRDFDPDQPILEGLPRYRRFKSYCGLGGSYAKLSRLLDEFEFVDAGTFDENMDWGAVPVVQLAG